MKQLKTSYMNKKQKDHQSIIPGHSIAARVVNYDLGFAIRIWKKKLKDSDILLKLKENKENMENMQLTTEEINTNFPIEKIEKEENETQLLNKKRKQSDGLNELKKELLDK